MQVLAALQAVDWVVSFSSDTPESLIDRLTPDVLVKGGDYREEQVAGAAAVRSRGGKVEIMQYRDDCSTSRIIEAAARSLHEPEEGATT